MSLLCQLYSLYESIQEYKGACQAASSPDCTYWRLDSGVHLEGLGRDVTVGKPFLLDTLSAFAASLARKHLRFGWSSGTGDECYQFHL
uniref:Family with sequence similarity 89 member A n=2 Tax=Rhinopithecus TaxID=542827 RepID=A0A2K6LEU0_RHIBE